MSKLEYYARPLVAFDASNKDHRKWYYQFHTQKSWGHCPVRFICPNDVGYDLTIIIREQLINYYIQKEFAQKEPKLVDKKTKRGYNKASSKIRAKAILTNIKAK